MERREFLAAAGGIGATALAGCATANGEVPPPRVSAEALESGGWERVSDTTNVVFERDLGPATVTGTARSRQYVDRALATAVEERTLGAVSASLMVFNATRIGFSPDLGSIPGGGSAIRGEVAKQSRTQFESSLQERGLVDVERLKETTLDVDTGETATLTHYAAAYPFDDLSFDVRGEEVAIEGGKIDVKGWLAVWSHDGDTFVAGCACPGQDFERSVDKQLSAAIDVSIDIDLGLTPDAYMEECFGLMRSVH